MQKILWTALGVVLTTAVAAFVWSSDQDSPRTVVRAHDTASLGEALQRAHGDTTIELTIGDYGSLRLHDRRWDGVVIIRSPNAVKARFSSIELSHVAGLELRSIDVSGRIHATATESLRISDATVGDGIYLRDGSHHVEVRDSNIRGGRFGIWIQSKGTPRNHHVVVAGNTITGQTGDNVQIGSCDDVIIEDNTIADITDNADHNDGIQLMGGEDIVIRRNRLSGQDQAILLKPEPGALGPGTDVRRVRVENNLMARSRGAGIIVAGATDVAIVNNTGVENRFADIHLEGDNPHLEVWNNAVRQIYTQRPQDDGFSHHNCVLSHDDPGDTDVITTPSLTPDHRVVNNTSCAGAATGERAPLDDISRTLRGPDITTGAFTSLETS